MWKIYYWILNEEKQDWDIGKYHKEYKRRGYARRVAEQRYGNTDYEWGVSLSDDIEEIRNCIVGMINYG